MVASRRLASLRHLLGVAILASLTAAAAARADEAAAHAHFAAGEKAFADGDYNAAVAEFLAAYETQPHPDVLINIATSYERVYKPEAARDYYERFLRDASPTSPLRPLAEHRMRVLRGLPGGILVDANKPGASVRLVGEGRALTGTAPLRFEDLPPGRYEIHVELAYHRPFDQQVALDPGAQVVVSVRLEHETETLTVFSKPEGARVFLDDREEGVTPFSRPVEVGQRRRLRVELPDYPAQSEEIDVLRGHPVRRSINFKKPFRSGRSELVLGSMFYGGLAGVGIAEASGGPRLDGVLRLLLDTGASVVGIGVGLLVSVLASDDDMKVGHSSIILGGTAWGSIAGVSLAYGLKLSGQNTLGVTLLSGGLGLGAGILVARYNDTSPGDAAIVNSGGLWGSAAGLLLSGAIFSDSPAALGWLTLGGCAIGVVGGSLLAWRIEVSRGHVAVVDAFGMAGLSLAFAVGYGLGSAGNNGLETGARYGLGGMAVGLLVGAILSRRLKDDVGPVEAVLTHHDGRWALGLPSVRVGAELLPEGRDTRVTLDLAKGEF